MEQTIIDRVNSTLNRQIPEFDSTIPLLEQINSLQIFTIAALLEKEFNVSFHSVELTSKKFESITGISELVVSKLAATNCV